MSCRRCSCWLGLIWSLELYMAISWHDSSHLISCLSLRGVCVPIFSIPSTHQTIPSDVSPRLGSRPRRNTPRTWRISRPRAASSWNPRRGRVGRARRARLGERRAVPRWWGMLYGAVGNGRWAKLSNLKNEGKSWKIRKNHVEVWVKFRNTSVYQYNFLWVLIGKLVRKTRTIKFRADIPAIGLTGGQHCGDMGEFGETSSHGSRVTGKTAKNDQKNGGLNHSNPKHQTLMQTVWMGTLVQAYLSLSMGKQSSASKRKKLNAFCWDACFWTKIEELSSHPFGNSSPRDIYGWPGWGELAWSTS